MRKLISLVLLVAMVSLSIGAAVPAAANGEATTWEVWGMEFSQSETGAAEWAEIGNTSPSSVNLALPAVFDRAELELLIEPVVFGDIDGSDPAQANFYGYLNPAGLDGTIPPVYMNLNLDMNADGTADYILRTEMAPASADEEVWTLYSPTGDEWQLNTDIHGLFAGNTDTWEDYSAAGFSADKIVSITVYAYRDTGDVAFSVNIDDITLGSTVYNLGKIQDAINSAVDGDTINVHPGTYPEFIWVDKSLTVQSSGGAQETIIQPVEIPLLAGGTPNDYQQVVLISAPEVSFKGFSVKITGYLDEGLTIPDTGIVAIDYLETDTPEVSNHYDVNISNNIVEIDNVLSIWGILVAGYTGETVVNGNTVFIGSEVSVGTENSGVEDGSAIEIQACEGVVINDNNIGMNMLGNQVNGIWAVDTERVYANENRVIISVECDNFYDDIDGEGIEGIYFQRVEYVQANENIITLTGTGYAGYMEGLGLWDYSDAEFEFSRAEFGYNEITITFANPVEEAEVGDMVEPDMVDLYGIWAEAGGMLLVYSNNVTINASSENALWLNGLTCEDIYQSCGVYGNEIEIDGVVSNTEAEPLAVSASGRHGQGVSAAVVQQDYLDIPEVDYDSFAMAFGMNLTTTDSAEVTGNEINIQLLTEYSVPVSELPGEDEEVVSHASLSYAVGINSWDNYAPYFEDNTLEIISNVASVVPEDTVTPALESTGVSVALGFYVGVSEPEEDEEQTYTEGVVITGNSIIAAANGESGSPYVIEDLTNEQSITDTLADLADALDGVVTDGAAQAAEVDLLDTPSGLIEDGEALLFVQAIGIAAEKASGIVINYNDPVIGIADGLVTNSNIEELPLALEERAGYGESMGGGILLVDCDDAQVESNGLGALDEVVLNMEEDEIEYPDAGLFGAARMRTRVASYNGLLESKSERSAGYNQVYVFGILATSSEDVPEETVFNATISENVVQAIGVSEIVGITADMESEENSIARAFNDALVMGITSLVDSAVIQGNTIMAVTDSTVEAGALGDTNDVVAQCLNRGRTVGILTRGSSGNQILDNEVMAWTEGLSAGLSLKEGFMLDAEAMTSSRTTALGIAVLDGDNQTISGNEVRANTENFSILMVTDGGELQEIGIHSSVVNFSSGLLLNSNLDEDSGAGPNTVTQNSFEADSDMSILFLSGGTFYHGEVLGVSVVTNALIMNSVTNCNYNNVGEEPEPESLDMDIIFISVYRGILNIGSELNARYNYWGNPTGPSEMGEGFGTPLFARDAGDNEATTVYSWWLSHPIADLQEDNIGYYGFGIALEEGWNTFSVPMALEKSRWSDIVEMSSLDYEIAYYYDPTQEYPWVEVPVDDPETEINESYVLLPLDGLYIKMRSAGTVFLTTGSSMGLPTRELSEKQNWYLVGVTPYDDNYPFTSQMGVEDAFYNLMFTPGGEQGLTGVVSPGIGGQEPWYWTTNNESEKQVKMGEAYWVYMKKPGTQFGFIATPLPAILPIEEDN